MRSKDEVQYVEKHWGKTALAVKDIIWNSVRVSAKGPTSVRLGLTNTSLMDASRLFLTMRRIKKEIKRPC